MSLGLHGRLAGEPRAVTASLGPSGDRSVPPPGGDRPAGPDRAGRGGGCRGQPRRGPPPRGPRRGDARAGRAGPRVAHRRGRARDQARHRDRSPARPDRCRAPPGDAVRPGSPGGGRAERGARDRAGPGRGRAAHEPRVGARPGRLLVRRRPARARGPHARRAVPPDVGAASLHAARGRLSPLVRRPRGDRDRGRGAPRGRLEPAAPPGDAPRDPGRDLRPARTRTPSWRRSAAARSSCSRPTPGACTSSTRPGEVLRPREAFNWPEWMRSVPIPLGEGVVGVTAARREGMIVNDFPRSPLALRAVPGAAIAPWRRSRSSPAGALQGVIVVTRDLSDAPLHAGRSRGPGRLRGPGVDRARERAPAAPGVRARGAGEGGGPGGTAARVHAGLPTGSSISSPRSAGRSWGRRRSACSGSSGTAFATSAASGSTRDSRRTHTIALGEGVVGKAAQRSPGGGDRGHPARPRHRAVSPEARTRSRVRSARA